MGKMRKQIIGSILIVMLFMGIIAIQAFREAGAADDPFSAMYDSDAVFLEEVETVLQSNLYATEEEEQGFEDTGAKSGITTLGQSLSNQKVSSEQQNRSAKLRQESKKILEAIRSGKADIGKDSAFFNINREIIIGVYEQSRVDRFIVKYKVGSEGFDLQEAVDISIERTFTLPLETILTKEEAPESSQQDLAPSEETSDTGRMECIVLSEKVNPAELASVLRKAGVDARIEFFQPDFKIYFAGWELSYSEVVGELNLLYENSSEANSDINEANSETKQDSAHTGSLPDGEETVDPSSIEPELDPQELWLKEPWLEELLPEDTLAKEIIIALIDTSVDIFHPLLNGTLVDGWNFIDNTDIVYNSSQPYASAHGTHLAGIIAQSSQGRVKTMPLVVFGDHGAYTSDIIAAISFAEENGARIVNCSFGSGSYNPALKEAMENSNLLFIASAGNSRSDLALSPVYPAAFGLDNIISVASLNADSGFSYYSNYNNSMIDIAARGRDVHSSLPNGQYGLQSGTSMSAAYVSAAAGLVLNADNDLAATELKERLCTTGARLGHLQNKVKDARSLDAEAAIRGETNWDISYPEVDTDFDVHSYAPTPEESWVLFSSKNVIKVSAGETHTLALCSDGNVWAWGANNCGQLGNGNKKNSPTPVQVVGLTNITDIIASTNNSFAINTGGEVRAWGYNKNGQLGDGSNLDRDTPAQVGGINGVKQIAAGTIHVLALKEDGNVLAWGTNSFGQFGNGTTTDTLTTPVQVHNLTNITQVAAGYYHSLALKSNGEVLAFGNNPNGQLGDGTTKNSSTPVQVSGLSGVKQIESGIYHSLALKTDGKIWSWGLNSYGQLGDGTTSYQSKPVQVNNLTNITQVAAGFRHSLALDKDGKVYAWGENRYGQLGDGTTANRLIPGQVSNLTGITQISTVFEHSVALESDGIIWGWGRNNSGQLGLGSSTFLVPARIHVDFFNLGDLPISPQITIGTEKNKLYDITLSAQDIKSFTGRVIIINYDQAALQLADLCAFTKELELKTGAITATGITITQLSPGEIRLTVAKTIPDGKAWSGTINIFRFKALENTTTTVTVK